MNDDPNDPFNQFALAGRLGPLAVIRYAAECLLYRLEQYPTIEVPPEAREEFHRIASAPTGEIDQEFLRLWWNHIEEKYPEIFDGDDDDL